MREIEIKARVRDIATLHKRLQKAGVVLSKPRTQRDVVYAMPDWETRASDDRIWLRVRDDSQTGLTFTLKKPLTNKHDNIEHEVIISDAQEMEAALQLMGFVHFVTVVKTRQKGTLGDIEICVDHLEGVGSFIEVETLLSDPKASYKTESVKLWKVLEQLGVTPEDQELRGYDVIVRQRAGQHVPVTF